MKRVLASCCLLLLLCAGCSHVPDLNRPNTQDNFGVQMAKMSLWREALFRFQRAVQLNPGDAMAHNNLAVAYEANGDVEKARREYLEALKLDKANPYIQKNYSRYVEFLSRNKKRQQKVAARAASTATSPSPIIPPTAGATPAPPLPPPIIPPTEPASRPPSGPRSRRLLTARPRHL
ncbi:MAG: tetratricopeptide repeat protein [Acidobacteriota bacterium]